MCPPPTKIELNYPASMEEKPHFDCIFVFFLQFTGEFYDSDDESSDDESIPSPTGSPPPEAGARESQHIILFKQLNCRKLCIVRIKMAANQDFFHAGTSAGIIDDTVQTNSSKPRRLKI